MKRRPTPLFRSFPGAHRGKVGLQRPHQPKLLCMLISFIFVSLYGKFRVFRIFRASLFSDFNWLPYWVQSCAGTATVDILFVPTMMPCLWFLLENFMKAYAVVRNWLPDSTKGTVIRGLLYCFWGMRSWRPFDELLWCFQRYRIRKSDSNPRGYAFELLSRVVLMILWLYFRGSNSYHLFTYDSF